MPIAVIPQSEKISNDGRQDVTFIAKDNIKLVTYATHIENRHDGFLRVQNCSIKQVGVLVMGHQ